MSAGPPRRVSVVGSSGSGKTTFARRLAARLGAQHIELDAIYWAPDWSHVDDDTLRQRFRDTIASDTWVADGNYRAVQPLVLDLADTVVWLDLPLRTCLARMLPRTVRRIRSREALWGGNRETWCQAFVGREALFWWLVTQHRRRRREYAARFASPQYAGLRIHRFRSSAEAQAWLDGLPGLPARDRGAVSEPMSDLGRRGWSPASPGVRNRSPKSDEAEEG